MSDDLSEAEQPKERPVVPPVVRSGTLPASTVTALSAMAGSGTRHLMSLAAEFPSPAGLSVARSALFSTDAHTRFQQNMSVIAKSVLAPWEDLKRNVDKMAAGPLAAAAYNVHKQSEAMAAQFEAVARPLYQLPKLEGLLIPRVDLPVVQFRWASDLVDHMRQVVDRWRVDLGSSVDWVREHAARALAAVLAARDAVLNGDITAVETFIDGWLRLRVKRWRVEAVSMALLDEDILADSTGYGTLAEVCRRAKRYGHGLKPLTKTQLRHRRVAVFSELERDNLFPVSDRLADPAPFGDRLDMPFAAFDDPRVAWVLRRLKEDELQVALTYSEAKCTWPEAAMLDGHTPEFGTKVCRKAKRLAGEYDRRERQRGR
jgi:hypothetical protein